MNLGLQDYLNQYTTTEEQEGELMYREGLLQRIEAREREAREREARERELQRIEASAESNKITLFTQSNYDSSSSKPATFDPSKTNAIFMKRNGVFIIIDALSDTVDSDIIPFTIKSILNATKYVVCLNLPNNEILDVSSSVRDLQLETTINSVYIRSPSGLFCPLFVKIRGNEIILNDAEKGKYAVSFYSARDYKQLYDYFLVNPHTDVEHIPLKFKDEDKEHKIMSIINPTNFYVTLYKEIKGDPDFQRYGYSGIYINFDADVENINDYIRNDKLLDGKFTGAFLTKKTFINYNLITFNELLPYDLTTTFSFDMVKYLINKGVQNFFGSRHSIFDVTFIEFFRGTDYKHSINKFIFYHNKNYADVFDIDLGDLGGKVLSIKNTSDYFVTLF